MARKVYSYDFPEGVTVKFIEPNQAVVVFSPLGLAFNDLFRYVVGSLGTDLFISNESEFEAKAAQYIRQIDPLLKVKRAEELKITADMSVIVFLHLSKFPNHITEDWIENKKDLPYIGPKKREYPVGYGLGTKGGNRYLHQEDTEITPEVKEEFMEMVGFKKASLEPTMEPGTVKNKIPSSLEKEVEEKNLSTIKDVLENYKYGNKAPVPVKIQIEKKYLSPENQILLNKIVDFLLNLNTDIVVDEDNLKKKFQT